MITLKAFNSDLAKNAEHSFLLENYASGVSSLQVLCGDSFSANDFVLLGEFGQENAEIVEVSSVTGDTLSLSSATKYAHAESTRLSVLPYDQVRFYHTTGTTFDGDTPLCDYIDIQPQYAFSMLEDNTYATGYGWFVFYNSNTAACSEYSNYIPYTDFPLNSAQKIVESFLKSLNQRESQIISFEDALAWLSEGYSIAKAELNLVNREYGSDDAYSLTADGVTGEYDLPEDASKLISVWNSSRKEYVGNLDLNKLDERLEDPAAVPCYYLRGDKIGFAPLTTDTFKIRYLTKGASITSPSELIDLPDNNYSCLIDYMRFRAAPVLGRVDGADSYTLFSKALERIKAESVDRDASVDSWSIGEGTNV